MHTDICLQQRSIIPTMYPVYRTGIAGCILVSLKYEPEQSSIVATPVRVSHVPRKRHVGYGKFVSYKNFRASVEM